MHVKYLQTELLQHLHLQRNRTETTRGDVFDYELYCQRTGAARSRNTVHLLSSTCVLSYLADAVREQRYIHTVDPRENAVHFKGWIQEQAHFLRLEEAEEVEGRAAGPKEG